MTLRIFQDPRKRIHQICGGLQNLRHAKSEIFPFCNETRCAFYANQTISVQVGFTSALLLEFFKNLNFHLSRGSDTRIYNESLFHLQNITNLQPKYSFDSERNFLMPALLANNSFFTFASQHRATFFYFNAAPQWRLFNTGNWRTVQEKLTTVAVNSVVYVGVSVSLSHT